jgi:hypothetical protein
LLKIDETVVKAALSHDRFAIAARTLHKCKIPTATIVERLKMTEARVTSAIQGADQDIMVGRVIGSSFQERLDKLCDEDTELCCPVSLMLFRDPVIASDGFIYESASVKELIRHHQISPLTREALDKKYWPAKQKKSEVMAYREACIADLLQFAEEAIASGPSELAMATTALDRVMDYLEVLTCSSQPTLAARAADVWMKTGRPVHKDLRPYLGRSSGDLRFVD